MSVKDDLMHKLDALMKKHRGTGTATDEQKEDIPVLTEIIEPVQTHAEPESLTLPPIEIVAATEALVLELPQPEAARTFLGDDEVEALARDIFQRVMSDLGDHISTELRAHIAERLSAIIDTTVTTALDDFKQELSDIIGDAIADVLLKRAEKTATKQK